MTTAQEPRWLSESDPEWPGLFKIHVEPHLRYAVAPSVGRGERYYLVSAVSGDEGPWLFWGPFYDKDVMRANREAAALGVSSGQAVSDRHPPDAYMTVVSTSAISLDERVRKLLRSGWRPLGGHQHVSWGGGGSERFSQTMVKTGQPSDGIHTLLEAIAAAGWPGGAGDGNAEGEVEPPAVVPERRHSSRAAIRINPPIGNINGYDISPVIKGPEGTCIPVWRFPKEEPGHEYFWGLYLLLKRGEVFHLRDYDPDDRGYEEAKEEIRKLLGEAVQDG